MLNKENIQLNNSNYNYLPANDKPGTPYRGGSRVFPANIANSSSGYPNNTINQDGTSDVTTAKRFDYNSYRASLQQKLAEHQSHALGMNSNYEGGKMSNPLLMSGKGLQTPASIARLQ